MNRFSRSMMRIWAEAGPRFLPFADAASPDLPLSRLLRLSLVQVSVGMSLVLLVGTLNRVMIVELGLAASIVASMIALPVLIAPFRALIGFKSDTYRCVLGWRRVPFLFRGSMLQFGGLAIMPFALLVLAGEGRAAEAPAWIGQVAAALAFLLVGAGIHTTQTVGLALATDQARPEQRPNVVGLMYVMLLLGMIGSAFAFGLALAEFTPGRLIQVIQASAVITLLLNAVALWKQEPRRSRAEIEAEAAQPEPSFRDALVLYLAGDRAVARLLAIGLGTMAFGMQDVLLEPYGGEVLGMTVGETTTLTAALALGTLSGFAVASRVLSRGGDPFRMAAAGGVAGVGGFLAVVIAAPMGAPPLFVLGVLVVGLGAGLFGHGTLTATMNLAPKEQAGLALGAWGAVQATAAGIGVALGAPVRDIAAANPALVAAHGAAAGYVPVFLIEIALLLAALAVMVPLLTRPRSAAEARRSAADSLDFRTR
ncbi:MAG: PucC family protein [Acetobacteraceae bacterium]|nr:PucC family protein [Acetobacteraceae bacterium]MCX7684461.1 PucC family protein [Acetobacteraceae bacterium]